MPGTVAPLERKPTWGGKVFALAQAAGATTRDDDSDSDEDDHGISGWLHSRRVGKIVKSTGFEMAFGLLIILNTMVMCCEFQYEGMLLGHRIGYPKVGAVTSQALEDCFRVL